MAKTLYEWDHSSYPGAKKYPALFDSIQIGNPIVPNRIRDAVTEEDLSGRDGFVTG